MFTIGSVVLVDVASSRAADALPLPGLASPEELATTEASNCSIVEMMASTVPAYGAGGSSG